MEKFIDFSRRRYHKHYREKKIHLAVDILLAMVVLILVAFIISVKFGDFSYQNKLAVVIIPASEKIVSGQEAVFEIKYANASKSSLSETKFSFSWPDNFSLEEVSPVDFFDKRTNSFEAGSLIPGANGAIRIKGLVIGAPGSSGKIILNASYFSNNKFSNELYASDFVVGSSSLESKWNNPGVLYRGQPTAMSLDLKNAGQIDLTNLELNFINPDIHLSFEGADDKNIEIKNNQLEIKQIKSGADLRVDFNLTYDGKGDKAKVGLSGQAVMNGKKINQVNLEEVFSIKEPDLSVKINSEKSVINIDGDIVYKIILKNSGPKDISNMILDLTSGDSRHFLKPIKIKNHPFIRLAGSQIIFDKNLRPNEAQEIELTVKFSRQEIGVNDEARLQVAARYNIDGAALKAYYLSNPAKIRTTYQFEAETRYFSVYGDQLGVGPIPPIAGIPTKYWIFWQLKNQGNGLADLEVQAELPPGVIWSDESGVNKGDLSFDPQKNVFVWRVKAVDSLEENCRLAFALTIIPDAGNVAKDILLLKNIKYSFFDNFTLENIADSAGSLTNDLSADKYAGTMEKKNNR